MATRTGAVRIFSLAALGVFLAIASPPARAYFSALSNTGSKAAWQAGSPTTIFANNQLTWQLYTGNFPVTDAPTVVEAGAAFQNAFQSHNDVLGANISFVRAPDTNVAPLFQDGLLTMAYVTNQKSDFYGNDLTNALGVTYVDFDPTTGVMLDADEFINADPNRPPGGWSTTGLNGWTDPQATSTHEAMHMLGANHTMYFGARVFPFAMEPFNLMQDRCLAPDDRAFHRDVYGTAPFQGGRISGTVNLSTPGGTPCNKAIVVATDANGIPQAITATGMNGAYSLNVPAGTYSMTAFHAINSDYRPTTIGSDLDFVAAPAASDFVSATTVAGVVVTDGGAAAGGTIVANNPAGLVPCMWLIYQNVLPGPPQFQAIFLQPGTTQTLTLQIDYSRNTGNPVLTAGQISGITVGTGGAGDIQVAPNSWTTAAGTPISGRQQTIINVPVTVPAAAIPGFRNLLISLNINGNERLFLPGVIKVLGTGGLVASTPAAGNPAFNTHALGGTDVPLLRVALQAVAPAAPTVNNEDVRLRKLTFNLAGSGPTLPSVKLYIDGNNPGVVDAGLDPRVFSGAAYANNPVSESIPGTNGGTVTFDNIAVTVPAGQTINLLLTADLPAVGTGDYTASFDPTNSTGIIAHGMFWGDVMNCGGTTVTGGTQELGALNLGLLQQVRTTGGAVIPVGNYTPETQVTCRGTAVAASGTVGIEAEVKLLGTAFDGTGTVTSATTFATGSVVSVNVPGLADGKSYHWRARAISSTLSPGPWVAFGANPESAVDFSCDSTTTNPPTVLMQLDAQDGVTLIPLGGEARGAIVLSGTNGTNSAGLQVRLEVEVEPSGTPFTNTPGASSGFVASGGGSAVLISGLPTGDYQWQARSVDPFGVASTWVSFNAAPIHFHLDAIPVLKAKAGCVASASPGDGGTWLLWGGLGLALFLLALRKRSAAATLAVLIVAAALAPSVRADDTEVPLPRSLMEVAAPDSEASVPLPEPFRAQSKSWLSIDGYLGVLLMDFNFKALGTDFVQRELKGVGTPVLGLEGLVDLASEWRAGLVVEAGLYSDVRILSVGPEVSWLFSGSHRDAVTGMSDTQHFLKLAVLYEKLTVTKTNFGSFDSTVGVRLGYELRISLGDRWAVTVDGALQYSSWKYSPTIQSGDDKIGGFGGLISVGIAWLP